MVFSAAAKSEFQSSIQLLLNSIDEFNNMNRFFFRDSE